MAPSLRELIALSLLPGLGCALALAHGDLPFVAFFGGAIAMMTNEAMRLWRWAIGGHRTGDKPLRW